MVQLSMITIIFTSAFSALVAAKSCHNGGIYCGSALLNRGDYITKINTNLKANGLVATDIYQKQSLWACIEHGDITYLKYCAAGCNTNGDNDDFCTEDAAAEAAAERKRDVGVSWAA